MTPEATEKPTEKHLKGTQAEKLLEAWLKKNGFPEVDRRACGTGVAMVEDKRGELRFVGQRHDAFGCIDLMAMSNNLVWMIQVTTTEGVSHRRKKIEKHSWPRKIVEAGYFRISIFTHSATQNSADKRKYDHQWNVEDYHPHLTGWAWINKRGIDFDIRELDVEKHDISEEDKTEAARIVALPPEERAATMKALKKARKKGNKQCR